MPKANDKLSHAGDTIFAWASAPVRSGVAVVRISGPQAREVVSSLGVALPLPRVASLASLKRPGTQTLIDQALLLWFPAPGSYTGEDVVEFHTHGSPAVFRELAGVLSALDGVRLAEPGEFTRRAFLNGKMDLLEAEGVADLIAAETESQKKLALEQLSGTTGKTFESLRTDIIACQALIEAYIDFPDEDIPESVTDDLRMRLEELTRTIATHLDDNHLGEKIRDGLSVVILGPPNAGKSSLMNALAQRDVAIVSDQPGTTRDLIELHLDIRGYAAILVDTAGLRETSEAIESEGVKRAKARAAQADIKIALFDIVSSTEQLQQLSDIIDSNTVVVFNKADIAAPDLLTGASKNGIVISTVTGEGMDRLIAAIGEKIEQKMGQGGSPIISRLRHRISLEKALDHLRAFDRKAAVELQAEQLRRAAFEIAKITGRIELDDILDVVFSSFCIGK